MRDMRAQRKKTISESDLARQQHMEEHGSFLYCCKRDTLCVYMDGMWMTGCERDCCILDDPEYQATQKRIEENRRKNEAEHRQQRAAEKKDPPAPIRNQSGEYERQRWNEIHALEEKAKRLYRNNQPKQADIAMNRALFLRRELKGYLSGSSGANTKKEEVS